MIDYIKGTLVEKFPTQAVVDCSGVGYCVFIPVSTYRKLPEPNRQVCILVHLVHKEDTMELYGFLSNEEREIFRKLLGVSRVGPRIALAILSGIELDRFVSAIESGDVDTIARIPKVGEKTAQRIVVELKGKIGIAKTSLSDEQGAVEDALVALGMSRPEARNAIGKALKKKPDATTEELIKIALTGG